MPRRKVVFVVGGYYHVFNRGVNRRRIFFERENYMYFLRKVREYLKGESSEHHAGKRPGRSERPGRCAGFSDAESDPDAGSVRVTGSSSIPSAPEPPVHVIAYCLMPNHFHLLVRLGRNDFSDRMAALGKAYTQAVNRRFKRVGPLFQGRFREVEVDREEYLLHLSRYIHLNPVQAALVQKPAEWEYSSYGEYVGARRGSLPEPDVVLREFSSREAYRRFVEAGAASLPRALSHLALD